MTLFRQEALDHQRRRLWGDGILTQRMSYLAAGITPKPQTKRPRWCCTTNRA